MILDVKFKSLNKIIMIVWRAIRCDGEGLDRIVAVDTVENISFIV